MRDFRSELTLAPKGVIDGDTIRGDWDVGGRVWLHGCTFRLYGINTPELKGATRAAGLAAKARLAELLKEHARDGVLSIRTHKDRQDSFGRYLVEVMTQDGETTINEMLVAEGHAVRFVP